LKQNHAFTRIELTVMPASPRRLILFALCLMALLTACAPDTQPVSPPTPIYTIVTTPVPAPAQALSKREDGVILSVTGKIDRINAPGALLLNRDQISLAGLVEYDVTDPFLLRSVVFRGVLMRDLLALIGVHADAQTLRITALNDYSVDVLISEFADRPVLFALDQDGIPMTPDFRGPAMLVFPYDDFPYEHLVYEALWIWQISSIDVQ
jgi:hypothetical protein